jgi:hypothetical protein
MQRFGPLCAALVLLVVLGGCQTTGRQPQVRQAQITPSDLKPGDTAVITIEIADKYGIVDRVEGVVREDPRIKFKLRDDGIEPDKKARDGVWTLQVDVPFQAPPGQFTLEFTAFRSDGQPVIVRDKEGNAVPLTGSFNMVIRYPDAPQEKSGSK